MPKEEMEMILYECDMSEHIGHPLKLPYLAVFICLEGKAVIKVNFEKHLLKSSDLLVLSEDSLAVFSSTSKDCNMIYIQVKKEMAAEIAYKLPNRLFPFLWRYPLCRPMKEERKLLCAWLAQTRCILQEDVPHKRPIIINHLQNLFLYIAGRTQPMLTDSFVERQYSRKEKLCWRFWELICKNCRQHREVAFYADELCITPFYLSQIAKGFMNDTPKGLIERQVILEMKMLLETTDMSVKEIAGCLNFEDGSYMCRFFKRHTGISLTEYRKIQR